MLLAELLQAIESGAISTRDYRNIEGMLFHASANALADFRPIKLGETKSNPIQIIDFFSGAGGASLGFAAINMVVPLFRFLGGCDINLMSASTYGKNFGTPVVCEDILEIAKTPESIRAYMTRIGYDPNMPTIIIGCAPCQGFSSHGKKRWNEEDDDRNSLAIAFSRIVSEIQPTVFLMENVPEFLSKKYWHYFSKSREAFIKSGYIVKQKISNSADYGVPQERFRSVIIGMKKEFLLPEGYLQPQDYKTVRDAIFSLSPLVAGEADSTDSLHKAVTHKQSTIDVIRQVPHDGGNLPVGVGPKCLTRVNGFSDVYGRLSWDKPAITITHYARNPASGRYTHPVQDRGLTAREAARLQSFPDGFVFAGKSDDIYRQIGEAVPPLLSCGVAVSTLIELLSCEPTSEQLDNGYACVATPLSNSYSSVIAGIKNMRRRA
ncbi:MAG: DNA cytosine methyltransferase [Firmicutes bacterium]|nr:DNA cytosine methyltransferase [Bacillota bacterium]